MFGVFWLAIPLILVPVSGSAVDITACGQEVPRGEVGVLVADLDCSNQPWTCRQCSDTGCVDANPCTSDADCPGGFVCTDRPAVTIQRNGTLDMAGHAISRPSGFVIQCAQDGGRCTIRSSSGRGDVSGEFCVLPWKHLTISDVDVHDCTASGIEGYLAKIVATNVTSNRNQSVGIYGDSIRATNVTASDNQDTGLYAGRGLRGTDVTVQNNGRDGAICGNRFNLIRFTATGNGVAGAPFSGVGLLGERGRLVDSTLTGNTDHDMSGQPFALDLFVERRLRVVNTVCGNSNGWGVCTDD